MLIFILKYFGLQTIGRGLLAFVVLRNECFVYTVALADVSFSILGRQVFLSHPCSPCSEDL